MKEQVFIINHREEQFYFLFNRTLGTVNELIDAQYEEDDLKNAYRNMRIKWTHNGESKEFKVAAITTKFTMRKREVIKKLRQVIIDYFIENEPDIINVRYKEHLAQLCPYCESDRIEVEEDSWGISQYQTDTHMLRLDIKCAACKKEWTEHHNLAFIEPKDSVDNLTPVKRPKKKKSK